MDTGTKKNWLIDQGHSEIGFNVKHLAVSSISGIFRSFTGTVESTGDNFTNAAVRIDINSDSIDTNNSQRDEHLRSPAFFNTASFPTMRFNGTIQSRDEGIVLIGKLTLLETTRSVNLQVTQTGTGIGRFGDLRAGFEVSGKINRRDVGLNFALLTETGSMVVGEEINLHFDIQLILQEPK